MLFYDLTPGLGARVSGTEGDERALAWAALTLYVVVTSGQELSDRKQADRRLRQLLEELPEGPSPHDDPRGS